MFNKDISHILARLAAATLVVMVGVGIFSVSVKSQGGSLAFNLPRLDIPTFVLTAQAVNAVNNGFVSQRSVDEQSPYPVQLISSIKLEASVYKDALSQAGVSSSFKFHVPEKAIYTTVTGNRMVSLKAGFGLSNVNGVDAVRRATSKIKGIYFFDENTRTVVGSIQSFPSYAFEPSEGRGPHDGYQLGTFAFMSTPAANRADRTFKLRPIVVVSDVPKDSIMFHLPHRFSQFLLADARTDFEGPRGVINWSLPTAPSSYESMNSVVTSMKVEPSTASEKANVGESFKFSMKATGVSSSSWAISAGSLPPGLALKVVDINKAEISGYASSTGIYNLTVKATDAASSTRSAEARIKITVSGTVADVPYKTATESGVLSAQLVSKEVVKTTDDLGDIATFKFSVRLTAQNGDVYIPRRTAVDGSTWFYSRIGAGSINEISAVATMDNSSNGDTQDRYKIAMGESRVLRLESVWRPTAPSTTASVMFRALKWSPQASGGFDKTLNLLQVSEQVTLRQAAAPLTARFISSSEEKIEIADESGEKDVGEYRITFSLTAGNRDMRVRQQPTFTVSGNTEAHTGTIYMENWGSMSYPQYLMPASMRNDDSVLGGHLVKAGETRTFIWVGFRTPSSGATAAAVTLDELIYYPGDETPSQQRLRLGGDYKTGTLLLNVVQ